jgi:alanine dehydrogenase
MKIGIVREGKIPHDKRVTLTPAQCVEAMALYPQLNIVVQPSPIRVYKDSEYRSAGITLQEDLSDCDVLIGVKEVNIADLIPHKKYFFFSHTYKQQPYNKALLRAILDKKIQLIDFELLTKNGERVIAFGRYAGIVGMYNGLKGYGKKIHQNKMEPAHTRHNKKEMIEELEKLEYDHPIKILITGHGRVAGGAVEVLNAAHIKRVRPEDFITKNYDHNVFTQLNVEHYTSRKSDGGFDLAEFYADPSGYKSEFMRYAKYADLYVACHYWDSKGPYLFTREDARSKDFNIKMIADISCDIDGPVASTLRSSSIDDPYYGYDPINEKEADFFDANTIGVMAVDNLPCELPRDASKSFGKSFLAHILPALMTGDPDGIIERASETGLDGKLKPRFKYLEDYVNS